MLPKAVGYATATLSLIRWLAAVSVFLLSVAFAGMVVALSVLLFVATVRPVFLVVSISGVVVTLVVTFLVFLRRPCVVGNELESLKPDTIAQFSYSYIH